MGEMLLGIRASQDMKLSNIAPSLQEEIPLIKTENRLSPNLKAKEMETHLRSRLASLGSRRAETNTLLCLDLSDVRKEYAEKKGYLEKVWDGSEGEVHEGYWLRRVTVAEVRGSVLRGDVPGAETEVENPLRETADHFAALLWHPTLPVLCAGRRHQENLLPVQA